jgi:hypothetical protein
MKLAAFAFAVLIGTVLASPASALTLNTFSLTDPLVVVQDDGIGTPETSTLFTTEIKRDQNVQNAGRRGHDGFLNNGGNVASINHFWGPSNSVDTWSLGYDGDIATLMLDGRSASLNIGPDGVWNAMTFFLRADPAAQFTTSTTTVTVTHVNGVLLDTLLSMSVTLGQQSFAAFALPNFGTITSIAGTVRFNFTLAPGASGSPNSRLGFGVSAMNVTPVPPMPPVPLPAAAPPMLAGLVLLGLAARRRRFSA